MKQIDLDPRTRLLLFIFYSLAVALAPAGAWIKLLAYFILLILSFLLLGASRQAILRQTLIILPSVLFLFMVIALFNPGGASEKLPLMAILGIKILLIFGASQVFLLSIDFLKLIKALEWFRLPGLVLSILIIAYRYLFVFREESWRTWRAYQARTFSRSPLLRRIKSIQPLAQHIILRSLGRTERIYAAMLSRGYNGKTLRTMEEIRFGPKDFSFAGAFLLAMSAILLIP